MKSHNQTVIDAAVTWYHSKAGEEADRKLIAAILAWDKASNKLIGYKCPIGFVGCRRNCGSYGGCGG